MARLTRGLGLVGAVIAFVLIAGLNFAALDRQWNVPYLGIQEANAWSPCIEMRCPPVFIDGQPVYFVGCFKGRAWAAVPCPSPCPTC